MSLLWRERLRLALCPDRIEWVRLAQGFSPKVLEKRVIPVGPDGGGIPWRAPLDGLKQEIEAYRGPKLAVTVLLSSHFVRFAVTPASELVTEEAEEEALARAGLEDAFGEPAKPWAIRVSRVGYREPAVATALDAPLVEALYAMIRPPRFELVSVLPHCVAVYNAGRAKLPPARCGFWVAEPGRLVTATLGPESWEAVRAYPLKGDLAETLPLVVSREELLGGAAEADPIYLHAPRIAGEEAGGRFQALRLNARPGFDPEADRAVAMALGGLP